VCTGSIEQRQEEDEHANETADERRLRLARELIDRLRAEDEDADDDEIAARLQEQAVLISCRASLSFFFQLLLYLLQY
jgi:hypothetical protein